MFCHRHLGLFILTAATLLIAGLPAHGVGSPFGRNPSSSAAQAGQLTKAHLRWGARPGVFRYRLQLAGDREFADIILDRVVSGNEYEVSDLAPGQYFWRVAALSNKPLEFSSAGGMKGRPAIGEEEKRAGHIISPSPINPAPPYSVTADPVGHGAG